MEKTRLAFLAVMALTPYAPDRAAPPPPVACERFLPASEAWEPYRFQPQVLDVESASRSIRQDVERASQPGERRLRLADGLQARALEFEGPAGHRRFQITLPAGRTIEIYADRDVSGQELDEAVSGVASAYQVVPSAYSAPAYVPPALRPEFEQQGGRTQEQFRMTEALASLSTVYLFPRLGAAWDARGPRRLESRPLSDGALALSVSRAQDMWNQMSSPPEVQGRWRPLASAGRDSAERMPVDDPSLRRHWPTNTAVVAAARQGEYLPTYASWLEQGLGRLPSAPSLPAALAELSGRTFVDPDDSGLPITYHPVHSTNLGAGWVRGEDRPRIALLITGHVPADGSPNSFNARRQVDLMRRSLQESYPGVTIREVDQASSADLERALAEAQAFGGKHPGAESLVFFLAHGTNSGVDPARPDDRQNGSVEGHLALRDGSLTESQLKGLTGRYLGGFSSNLLLFYACESGAFVA